MSVPPEAPSPGRTRLLRTLPVVCLLASVPLAWWFVRWPFPDLFSGYAGTVALIGFTSGLFGLWTLRRERRGAEPRGCAPTLVYVLCGIWAVISLFALMTVYAEDEKICGEDGPVSCGGDGQM